MPTNRDKPRRSQHLAAKIWLPIVLLVIASLVVTFRFAQPSPPRRLVMATGSRDGAYHAFGQRYRDELARDGIKLELRPTAGSLENLELLERGEVDLAFIQGGVVGEDFPKDSPIRSLGSVAGEPLWVFVRGAAPELLSDLRGKRLAIGPDGSGTAPLARRILEVNGVTADDTVFLPLTFGEARDALEKGTIDAAFFVASHMAGVVEELIERVGISVMNFRRYDAYARNMRFLKSIEVPEGLLNLRRNVPRSRITLLATTAGLSCRKELHPAVAKLLVGVAKDVHGRGGLLDEPGEYPTPAYVQFPLHEAADDYYTNGPSFLSRYLPFQAVSLLNRLKILLLPLLTLALPLFKLAPVAYRWGIHRRIYRWYRDLGELEAEMRTAEGPEAHAALVERLDKLQEIVAAVNVPVTYRKDVYNLRMHIELVREALAKRS